MSQFLVYSKDETSLIEQNSNQDRSLNIFELVVRTAFNNTGFCQWTLNNIM